jgi:hypothetical protein
MFYNHSGHVSRILSEGFILIHDKNSSELYVINIAKHIENYTGESPWELGIAKNTPCIFSVDNNKITSIYFYTKKNIMVKFLESLKKLSTNLFRD